MEEVVGSIPTRSTIESTTYGNFTPDLVAFGSKFPKPISKTGANTVRFPPLSRLATGASTDATSAGTDSPLAVIGARVLRFATEVSAPSPAKDLTFVFNSRWIDLTVACTLAKISCM